MLRKWELGDSPRCDSGQDIQTANRIAEEHPVCNVRGGIKHLHISLYKVTAASTIWLTNLDIRVQILVRLDQSNIMIIFILLPT